MALLAEYGFNEGSGTTSADSSGNSHNLTASNSSTSWDANGKNGSAAKLEHTGAVGPNAFTTTYTVMAWVKRTSTWSGFAGIFVNSVDNFYLEADAGASPTNYAVNCFAGTSTTGNSTTPLGLNTWVHVCAVSTSGTVQLYINGTAEGSTGVSSNHNFSNTNWVVAGSAASTGENSDFVGLVDELRIFDTALSGAQITTWMNTPIGGSGTPLMWITA